MNKDRKIQTNAYRPPRWVKIFGVIVILLVVLFFALHLTGNSLIHLQPITILSEISAMRALTHVDRGLQVQLVIAATAALLLFLVNTTLAVYKPKGRTKYGWRKHQELQVTDKTG